MKLAGDIVFGPEEGDTRKITAWRYTNQGRELISVNQIYDYVDVDDFHEKLAWVDA